MPEANRPKRPRQGARPGRGPSRKRAGSEKAEVTKNGEASVVPPPVAEPEPVAEALAAPPEPQPAAPEPEPAHAQPEPAHAQPGPALPEPEPPAAPRSTYDLLWDTGVLNVLTLAGRDLARLFLWPVSPVVGAAVIVPVAVLGYLKPGLAGDPVSMAGVFRWVAIATAVLTPLVTTRLVTAERRSGALEQLLSAPVRCWEVVAAKWLAGVLLYLAGVVFTLVYVALLAAYLHGVDAGAVLTGYTGLVLVGGAWVAVGLLAASVTTSRVAAVVAGAAALLVLQSVLGYAAGLLSPPLSDVLDYASAASRAQSFDQGRLVLRDAVYFVSLTAGALFLTARVLAARRWR